MSDYIEIPDEFPEGWPNTWSGNTTINCGEQGSYFHLEIVTDGHPSRIHIDNYKEIMRRWPQLWPQVHAILSDMLTAYKCDHVISHPNVSFDMRIPAEPIGDGVTWNVGAEFQNGQGVQWEVGFCGWTAFQDLSQPVS
jgi:hypothetical protein